MSSNHRFKEQIMNLLSKRSVYYMKADRELSRLYTSLFRAEASITREMFAKPSLGVNELAFRLWPAQGLGRGSLELRGCVDLAGFAGEIAAPGRLRKRDHELHVLKLGDSADVKGFPGRK
jgi:hypothetical protein